MKSKAEKYKSLSSFTLLAKFKLAKKDTVKIIISKINTAILNDSKLSLIFKQLPKKLISIQKMLMTKKLSCWKFWNFERAARVGGLG